MTGYNRTYSKSPDDIILSSDFNNEFEAIDNAFDSVSGHTHSGTAGEGAPVIKVGDGGFRNSVGADSSNNRITFTVNVSNSAVPQIHVEDGVVAPNITNDVDLGTSSRKWKNLYVDGVAYLDSAEIGAITITGNFSTSGTTTIGNDSGDTLVVTSRVGSGILPTTDDMYDLGSSALRWKDLYVDGAGYIDTIQAFNVYAGGLLSVTGTTNLNGDVNIGDGSGDNVAVNGEFISSLIPNANNTVDLGRVDRKWRNLYIDGEAVIDLLTSTNVNIDGGNIDATAIGVATPSTGRFTTLSTTGNTTVGGDISVTNKLTVDGRADLLGEVYLGNSSADAIRIWGHVSSDIVPILDNALSLGSPTNEWYNLYIDGTANIDSLVADTADINGGTIDGAVIGATTPAAATVSTLNVTGNTTLVGALAANGNITLGDASTDTINPIARFVNNLIPSTNNIRDLGSTTLQWRNLYVDGVGYIDSVNCDTLNCSGTITSSSLSVGTITTSNSLIPTTSTQDLGALQIGGAGRWRNLYLSGSAFIVGDIGMEASSIVAVGTTVISNEGVKFNNVTSSDPNTLDWYEENNSLATVLSDIFGNQPSTIGSITARSTRIGRQVTLYLKVEAFSRAGMMLGYQLIINNIPYEPIATTSQAIGSGILFNSGSPANTYNLTVQQLTNYLSLNRTDGDGKSVSCLVDDIANNNFNTLWLTITYFV